MTIRELAKKSFYTLKRCGGFFFMCRFIFENAILEMKDSTEEYAQMLEAFGCNFTLSRDESYGIDLKLVRKYDILKISKKLDEYARKRGCHR